MKKIIAVDFDGVLCNKKNQVIKRGKNEVQRLYDSNINFIIIYTSRANTEKQYFFVSDFLKKNGIPYHCISLGKLKYDLLIDDHVLKF